MNETDIDKQIQEAREKRALDHLAICERIRKKLELPQDALPLIDKLLCGEPDIVGPRLVRRTEFNPATATRAPLRLVSKEKVPKTDPISGKPTPIVARPQMMAMRVEEIEILGEPDHWMVADVQVGYRSQFPQAGPPLPGRLFAPGGTCYRFVTETIQTAMDFTLLVHYVGPDPEGEGGDFEAVAMGTIASYT